MAKASSCVVLYYVHSTQILTLTSCKCSILHWLKTCKWKGWNLSRRCCGRTTPYQAMLVTLLCLTITRQKWGATLQKPVRTCHLGLQLSIISNKLHIKDVAAATLCSAKGVKVDLGLAAAQWTADSTAFSWCCSNKTVSANVSRYFIQGSNLPEVYSCMCLHQLAKWNQSSISNDCNDSCWLANKPAETMIQVYNLHVRRGNDNCR